MPDTQDTIEPGQNLPAPNQAPQTSASPRERALAAGWSRQVDTYGGAEWWTGLGDEDELVAWDRMDRATSADCRWAVRKTSGPRLEFVRDEDDAVALALRLRGIA